MTLPISLKVNHEWLSLGCKVKGGWIMMLIYHKAQCYLQHKVFWLFAVTAPLTPFPLLLVAKPPPPQRPFWAANFEIGFPLELDNVPANYRVKSFPSVKCKKELINTHQIVSNQS